MKTEITKTPKTNYNPIYTTIQRFTNAFQKKDASNKTENAEILYYRLLKEFNYGEDKITYSVYITREDVQSTVDENENTYINFLKNKNGSSYTEAELEALGNYYFQLSDNGTTDFVKNLRQWVGGWKAISYDSYAEEDDVLLPSVFGFIDGKNQENKPNMVKVTMITLAYLKQVNADNTNSEYTTSTENCNESGTMYDNNIITATKKFLNEEELVYKWDEEKEVNTQAYSTWLKNCETLAAATGRAKAAYDAISVYDKLKLTENIIVSGRETADMTWPKGYIFDGDYHRIDGLGTDLGETLFDSNNGIIKNVISPDGRLVSNTVGTVYNCIVKLGESSYNVYDLGGTATLYDDDHFNGDNSNDDNFGLNGQNGW